MFTQLYTGIEFKNNSCTFSVPVDAHSVCEFWQEVTKLLADRVITSAENLHTYTNSNTSFKIVCPVSSVLGLSAGAITLRSSNK